MSERRILNSWKEIASYLGRGVRTVQRWEAQLGLPVHRPAGKDHSAVVAFSTELDQWLDSRPVRQIAGMQLVTSPLQTADMRELVGRAEMLLQKLNTALVRSDEMHHKLSILLDNVMEERASQIRTAPRSRPAEVGAA